MLLRVPPGSHASYFISVRSPPKLGRMPRLSAQRFRYLSILDAHPQIHGWKWTRIDDAHPETTFSVNDFYDSNPLCVTWGMRFRGGKVRPCATDTSIGAPPI